MDLNKNYYKILGVNDSSSMEEIKKSYKKLAMKYHPDRNKGDKNKENRFKEISEAYNILSNKQKKQNYDTQSPHGNSYNPNTFKGMGGGFNDIFETFFSGGFGGDPFGGNPFGGNPFSGNPFTREEFNENLDININVVITLKDVYKSNPIEIKYNRYQHCESCEGTGFDRDSESYTCDMCGGRRRDKFRFNKKCEYCMGLGKIFSGECKKCNGKKVLMKETKFNLNNIHKIRKSSEKFLRGYGHQSKYYRNKKGILKLKIIYQQPKKYIINEKGLIYNLDIHYEDAIKGIKYEYENLDGKKLKIKIPNKSNDGDLIRIKGKGLYKNIKKRSDLYFKLNIIIDYNKL